MAAIDNAAKLRATALAAIERQCMGEDFGFDAAPVVGHAQGGGAMALYALIVTKKNPILGQGPLVNVTHLPTPAPTAEQVEKAVTDAMTGLRKYASELLAANQHPLPPPTADALRTGWRSS